MKKLLALLFISGITLSSAITCSFWLAEHVFFDRLFYQKSWLHGYDFGLILNEGMEEQWQPLQRLLFQQRLSDIKFLIQETHQPTISNKCPAPFLASDSINYTKQRPLTIAVIGDSNAYGMGVRTNQRFGNQLELQLNQVVPAKVYTLAEPGNDIIDMLSLYILANDYLDIDFAIFSILENDFIINADLRYPNSSSVRSVLASKCGSSTSDIDADYSSWSSSLQATYPLFAPTHTNSCQVSTALSYLSSDPKVHFLSYYDYKQDFLCESDRVSAEYCLHKFMMNTYIELIKQINVPIVKLKSNPNRKALSKLEGHPPASDHQELATLLSHHIIGHIRQQKSQLQNN